MISVWRRFSKSSNALLSVIFIIRAIFYLNSVTFLVSFFEKRAYASSSHLPNWKTLVGLHSFSQNDWNILRQYTKNPGPKNVQKGVLQNMLKTELLFLFHTILVINTLINKIKISVILKSSSIFGFNFTTTSETINSY